MYSGKSSATRGRYYGCLMTQNQSENKTSFNVSKSIRTQLSVPFKKKKYFYHVVLALCVIKIKINFHVLGMFQKWLSVKDRIESENQEVEQTRGILERSQLERYFSHWKAETLLRLRVRPLVQQRQALLLTEWVHKTQQAMSVKYVSVCFYEHSLW